MSVRCSGADRYVLTGTLRNAIIQGAEPIVGQETVVTSASVLAELRDVSHSEGR